MSDKVLQLTEKTFDSETAEKLVLVDFWAPWCGPCKMQAPIVDDVAERIGAKALIAKVNVDEAPELAARFGVRSIPTLIVLKNGKSVEQLVGLRQADDLVAMLERHGQ